MMTIANMGAVTMARAGARRSTNGMSRKNTKTTVIDRM